MVSSVTARRRTWFSLSPPAAQPPTGRRKSATSTAANFRRARVFPRARAACARRARRALAHRALPARGKTIFRRASPGTAMMAVLRGGVKICTVSRGGKEAVLNVIGPGRCSARSRCSTGVRARPTPWRYRRATSWCSTAAISCRSCARIRSWRSACSKCCAGVLRKTSQQLEDAFFLDMPGASPRPCLCTRRQAGRSPPTCCSPTRARRDDRHRAREHEQAAPRLGAPGIVRSAAPSR